MELKITIDDRVLRSLPAVTAQRVQLFLDAEAEQMVNGIKQSIRQTSMGRVYVRPNGTIHIASRPGDPPNIDEGTLINDYRWEPRGPDTRWILTSVDYAPDLEFGKENTAPRPHVGPEVERTRERLPRDAQRFGLVKP